MGPKSFKLIHFPSHKPIIASAFNISQQRLSRRLNVTAPVHSCILCVGFVFVLLFWWYKNRSLCTSVTEIHLAKEQRVYTIFFKVVIFLCLRSFVATVISHWLWVMASLRWINAFLVSINQLMNHEKVCWIKWLSVNDHSCWLVLLISIHAVVFSLKFNLLQWPWE